MIQVRAGRPMIYIVAALLFIVALGTLGYHHRDTWDTPEESLDKPALIDDEVQIPQETQPEKKPEKIPEKKPEKAPEKAPEKKPEPEDKQWKLLDLLKDIHKPIVKPNQEVYKPYGAVDWKQKNHDKAPITEPLGSDLCIIDIDNRPFDEAGQVFSDSMSWDHLENLHGLSLGVLNHWLYAKIHGYKYYFVTFDTPEHRRSSWEKPYIISKLLAKHKTCVYVDSDAVFYHLDLPMEWLINYWQIDPKQHSMALSWDPNFKHNKDEFGKLYLNTGFIILQNNKKTFNILKDWDDCTNEKGKHPRCHDFSFNEFGRPTDQGGFGTFIRYDYPDNIKDLPCAEANGFPEDPSECKGVFIRHMWSGKDTLIKMVTGHQFPGKFLDAMHSLFRKEKKDFYLSKNKL